MSLQSRARRLMREFPLTYQQALVHIRKTGVAPAERARSKGISLSDADVEILSTSMERRVPDVRK